MAEEVALLALLHECGQIVKSSKELWNSLEAKYMAEDTSSKKFLVSNFINYKMTGLRPVMKQYIKLLGILGRFTQHKMNMDEAIQIEESLKVQDNDKPKGNNVAGPYNQMFRLNIVNDNIASAFMSTSKLNDSILWHARLGHVHFKRKQDMSKDGLIPTFDMDTKKYLVMFIYYIQKMKHQINSKYSKLKLNYKKGPKSKDLGLIGEAVSQLEYSRVIGCLMYAMTCTRPAIAFAVGKLSRYTSNPGTQHWQAIQRASKKQTCITGSTIESEFVALAAAGKEAEWLKNLLFEIPLWVKPIAPISIRYDSAATLAKAYSQMYNGKSRHLGVRHSMIRELIMNEVISIEFVRSQQNLADHLTKGLARDLVIKSAEGIRLKHMYLHIIPRMCLEPAEKEDEVFTSQWLISLKKCLARARIKRNHIWTTEELVGTSNVSSVRNDALMSIIDDMHDTAVVLKTQLQEKDNAIRNLKAQVSKMNDRSCETYNAKDVTALIEQNECIRVELEKVKQHYKEFKESCFTSDSVKPKVLAPGMYAIDVKPIPHPLKNNRSAHLNYISHLKESVETVREIVEEARVVKPLDNALNYTCQYTKLSQELLEYVIGTCPKSFNERDNKAPSTPVTRKKQVTFSDKPGTSSSNTQKHEVHQKVQQTNIPMIPSTGVNTSTEASGSKPRSNTKKNRILPAKRENKKKVEDHLRTNKSVWTKVNRVDSSISYRRVVINSNSESVCKMCNKCLNSANHEMCVVNILSSVNATPTVKIVLNKGKQIWKPKGKLSDNSLNKTKRVWKATGKLFADIGYQWRPTGKKFALGEMCPLTKLSVKCRTGHPLVSGLRLFKTYDGESFKAQEFCGKVHRDSQIRE
ncbi:retrovirus-related pol polyprotein from transposon TNT 1-94 [Tanacetum coccineum]